MPPPEVHNTPDIHNTPEVHDTPAKVTTSHPVLRRVGVVVICVAALIGLAMVTIFSVKSDIRRAVLQTITGPYPDGRDASWHTPAGEELIHANNQHFYIAYQIAQCFQGMDIAFDTPGPPAKISIPLMLGLQPNGEISWIKTSATDSPKIELTNYQRSILTLSNGISTARTQLASFAADSNNDRFFLQILIIVIGALTTIFVSVKSILEKDERYSRLVGILAIIFAALGTAFSSINSFIGPGDSFAKTEHALLQARQLHLDLGLLVAQERVQAKTDKGQKGQGVCADFDPDKTDEARTKKITDLEGKLRDVVGLSGPAAASNAQTSEQPSTGSLTTKPPG